jgi:Tfp pilus assembly protein PilW
MKPKRLSHLSGFTLVEVMVSLFLTILLLAGFMVTIISLEKSFFGASDYTEAINNAQRIADYISRDVRRASAASVSGSTLTLTIPSYYASYDAQGNPSPGPILTGSYNGTKVVYNSGNTLTVKYLPSGNNFLRQQSNATDLVIASNVPDFTVTFSVANNAVNYTLSFTSKLTWYRSATAANPGGSISETVTMRNAAY